MLQGRTGESVLRKNRTVPEVNPYLCRRRAAAYRAVPRAKTEFAMELDLDLKLIFAILNGKVSAAIYRQLQRHFSEAGLTLTPEQWTVLLYLSEQDGVSQQRLCEATYKEKPAMSHLLDSMEQNGLVLRRTNPRDRRSNLVHLTPQGRMVKSRGHKVAVHTLKEALRGLGEESLIISQHVLRQIFENTTSDRTAPTAAAPARKTDP